MKVTKQIKNSLTGKITERSFVSKTHLNRWLRNNIMFYCLD